MLLAGAMATFASAATVVVNFPNESVAPGANKSYYATVTGLQNTTVTWSVNGVNGGNSSVGTISNGWYTAPTSVPATNPVTIKAASVQDPTVFGTSTLTISASLPGVRISPGYTSIGVNQTLQYSAAVTNLANTSVTWKVNSTVGGNSTIGTITAGGLYTAPAVVPTIGTTITALASDGKTSDIVYVNVAPAGPGVTQVSPNPVPTGTSTITLTGSGFVNGAVALVGGASMGATWVNATTLKVTVYQGKAGLVPVQIQNPGTLWGPVFNVPFYLAGPPPVTTILPTVVSVNLGATRQFTSNAATSWSATAGSIDANGLYTAPAVMPGSSAVTVKATGPGGTASAAVTLVNPNAQKIAPLTVTLNLGATQQFTSGGATSWQAVSGSVDVNGLYTAPAVFPASGTDAVTAIGPGGSAMATVTLNPPTPTLTSVGVNNQIPLGIFSVAITGTGFTNKSTAKLGASVLTVNTAASNATTLSVSGFSSTSGAVNVVVSNGASASQPFAVQVGVPNAVVSAAAARRFLEQAAFGPTPADADHVQAIGFQAWIDEQFALPVITNLNAVGGSQGGLAQAFLTNAVNNADQLRQRVAFALSQIFVVSITKLIWNPDVTAYEQLLVNDAFTNYPQILQDVTLSPGMGEYLDMANNAKANPAAGTAANENYAREIMQLFSMGDVLLNIDGTPKTDVNGPIPAYLQPNVSELARVFTGWTYPPKPGGQVTWPTYINSSGPMVPYNAQHDFGSKTLLNGYVAPANLSPLADLQGALGNIASHPNVAPFISKQLIQHLVKSNPTPAYVTRIAQLFLQTNGDMKSVVPAILLDPEARANDQGGNDLSADGHMQEPALFVAGFVRAFGGTMTTANYFTQTLAALGQDIYNPASVFNYYSPGYTVGGTGGLKGGEFQIYNPNTAILRENLVAQFFSQYSNPIASNGPGTTIDLTPLLGLAATPAILMDAIDLTLTHGTMPAAMKQIIATAVGADQKGQLHRVQTAIYLTLTSGYYNVWH